jgi:ferredoxin--NADP+ reductase
MGEWIQARLSTRRDWTEGLMTVQFEDVKPRFIPGQFFNIGLTLGETRIRRSYSAASAPDAPLEFVVSRVPSGVLTPSLFDVQPGQLVDIDTTPAGFFTLDFLPPGVRDLWLIATGTGIGPYLSMKRGGVLDAFERVVLVHGVRRADELTYAAELEAFAQQPNRFYVPTVTGEGELSPSNLRGRIPTLLESAAIEKTIDVPLDFERSHVLLCGNPQMIKDGIAVLEQRGLKRHKRRDPGHITTEKYW